LKNISKSSKSERKISKIKLNTIKNWKENSNSKKLNMRPWKIK
jgi:hypothetical protein